ncbi:MAG: PHP domain-containing protein [Phycisphaeraceae bacterium]
MYCDLHMHSTASDGTDPPGELPRLARQAGMDAIALTDHDTTAGVEACAAAAAALDLAFVPGIELSARLHEVSPAVGAAGPLIQGVEMHLLGYFIDPDDADLAAAQRWLVEARAQRNPRLVERLNDLGVRIGYEEVLARAGDGVVGRPHIAQLMVQKGYVRSLHEAFIRYIGEGGAAYQPKARLTAARAIAVIHDAGGLACLAHPVQLNVPDPDAVELLVRALKELGLDAIETHHSDHRQQHVEHYQTLAKRFDLLVTGGSDYHGSHKACRIGQPSLPMSVYHRLAEAAGR